MHTNAPRHIDTHIPCRPSISILIFLVISSHMYVLKLFTLWSMQQNSIELFENTHAKECRIFFLFTLKNGSYTQKYTNKCSPLYLWHISSELGVVTPTDRSTVAFFDVFLTRKHGIVVDVSPPRSPLSLTVMYYSYFYFCFFIFDSNFRIIKWIKVHVQ